MPESPGTVPRYMLPVMVGAGSGWRRGEVHEVEQGGSWCSHPGSLMPYCLMCTAKGPKARCSLWGWMSLRRAPPPPCVGASLADPHGVCP